ncbi:MAG: tetratricopeptide repeat protein [Deltaproteobacteria bacterium]|nr:tetratricopeptide repeat protein [Deltaproteobacteria bacterium]MBI3388104.1 tetratricopeptide repeat protein [Deltaproteobacteria bacterium]
MIEPLAVPEDLEKLGYSGEVLARWLAERVQEINRKASTPMRRREFVLHEDDGTASVPIPGIGTTVQSVLSPLRSLFGTPQDRVTGDIVVTEKKGEVVKVRLQMHVRGKPRVTVDGDAKELPKLFEEAGEVVVRRMQPYVLASYLCPEGGSDECQQILDEALNAGDAEEQVRALSLRGLIFAYQGQPSKATELYQHATELDPTFAFPWYGRGNDLFDLRRDEEAIAKYQHAIELDPKFAPPWTGWGNALLHLQRDEEAIAKYQHAIELDPKDAIPWSNWGIALVHLQRDDEAIPKSEHAAELDPKLPNPWFWWGEALVDLHRDKEASAKYQHATELDPKFAPAWHAQVRVLERLGRREKAEHVRARAAESGVQVPTDSE